MLTMHNQSYGHYFLSIAPNATSFIAAIEHPNNIEMNRQFGIRSFDSRGGT